MKNCQKKVRKIYPHFPYMYVQSLSKNAKSLILLHIYNRGSCLFNWYMKGLNWLSLTCFACFAFGKGFTFMKTIAESTQKRSKYTRGIVTYFSNAGDKIVYHYKLKKSFLQAGLMYIYLTMSTWQFIHYPLLYCRRETKFQPMHWFSHTVIFFLLQLPS